MLNFKDLLNQVQQKYLPVTCDEGVYRIARQITLTHEKEFENIVLVLGNFHLIKVVLSCIGKYLKNSGVDNIFIETGLFGVNVTDQILAGTNYARSVKAYSYLCEALQRMQLDEFLTEERLAKYEDQIITIELLRENYAANDIDSCPQLAKEFKETCSELLSEFRDFVVKRCKESELYNYWNSVVILINLMQNLIRADRTGDWDLHLETVEKLLPIFHVMDRTNYSRWCSVYFQDMMALNKKHRKYKSNSKKGALLSSVVTSHILLLVEIKRWNSQ